MQLPQHVHKVRAKGRDYYYWQPGRGTKGAGARERLPDPNDDPRGFWARVEALGGRPEHEAGTIAAAIHGYRTSPEYTGLSASTKRDYDRYLDVLETRWGTFMVRDIRPKHVAELRDSYGERRVSGNHMLAIASVLFAWAAERGYRADNPCREVRRSKVKTDGFRPWTNMVSDRSRSVFAHWLAPRQVHSPTGDRRMTGGDVIGAGAGEPQPAGALDRLEVLRESLREVRDAAEAAGQVAIAHRLACMVTDLHATISAVRQLTPAATHPSATIGEYDPYAFESTDPAPTPWNPD